MQRDIRVVVKDRVARTEGQPVIVCGNGDYTVTFSFDDEWSEASTKTARFKYLTAEGMKHKDVDFAGSTVKVPTLSNIREVEVGVYAGGLATSTGAPIRCEPSVRCGSGEEEEDPIQPIIDSAREACRSELETALETATGENYDGKTWEELNETVKAIPILTPEKQEDIDGLALVRLVVETSHNIGKYTDYSITTHPLFTCVPKNAEGKAMNFALPYFNTSRARWQFVSNTSGDRCEYFTSYLKEIGLDCTSAVNLGSANDRYGSIFLNFEKLKLTNVSCNFEGAFFKCGSLRSLEIYGKDGSLKFTSSASKTFSGCSVLEKITGDELDFSAVTNTYDTFRGCNKLRHIRFKPFTINTSLNFGDCNVLHLSGSGDYDNLLSILNGITLDKEVAKNITLTFSTATTDITTDMADFWGCHVWWQDDGTYTLEQGDSVFAEPESLYSAFITKGVTIAWK